MDDLFFKSRSELGSWLADKPTDWGQVIAARAALRAFPYLNDASTEWQKNQISGPLRALLVSWTARNAPSIKLNPGAAKAAAIAADLTVRKPKRKNNTNVVLAIDAAYLAALSTTMVSIRNVSQAVKSSAEAAANFVHNEHQDVDNLEIVSDFPNNIHGMVLGSMWKDVSDDCHWLASEGKPKQAARRLANRKLSLSGYSIAWDKEWKKLESQLLSINPNYSVWIDWYERRIRGERAAFDIPGDKGRIEDKKILRRLAEATDEDFWGKGHEYVNATLKGWLDEARERVAPTPPILAEASGTFEITGSATVEVGPLPSPPQDLGAITYGVNEQGKLDRLPNSDQVHLRDVADQRRAYSDLREAAAELSAEGQRLGQRLTRALDRFLRSLPNHFDNAEAYLVWRDANALRRLHRAHREATKTPEPDEAKLEPVIAESLGGLLDLYNNFAFADDGLRAKDEARISPQERVNAEVEAKAAAPLIDAILATPQIATPEALDDIAADAEDAGLSANDPYAAQVLDQANRTKRNWVAALLTGAMEAAGKPKLLGKRAAIGLATGVGTAVGTVVAKQVLGFEYAALFDFIATNAALFNDYATIAFSNYPHLPDLIERIRLHRLKSGSK
jgi:hypothetical protein